MKDGAKVIIIEGARGTGKTTLTRSIRQRIEGVTLMNLTGKNIDNEDGYYAMWNYYGMIMDLIDTFVNISNNGEILLIDRFIFSEMVFSKLYKNYSFKDVYHGAMVQLGNMVALEDRNVEIHVVLLESENDNLIKSNLNRDKVKFANIEDTLAEIYLQRESYRLLFDDLHKYGFGDKKLINHKVSIDGKSIDDVYDEVISITKIKDHK